EGVLTISGRKAEAERQANYLHQGIAARSFERRFQLADHMEIHGARLENGLLHVDIQRVIPEEKKARRIAIDVGSAPSQKPIDATPLRVA
ncbi:MAG TPA: hypothetical protein DCL48_08580, partial [Alphaproteobacteria bacterium]|nr:hypothetical protein [Alphaproteobacteria bacterium]